MTSLITHPFENPMPTGLGHSYRDMAAAREAFWHNVLRQILMSLSMQCLQVIDRTAAQGTGEGVGEEELFDGRLAIMTHGGERIPIAQVHPVLACGINTNEHAKNLSMAVECTVFQVRTPAGEVFTLPLHEIRAFHALTPELMKRLEDASKSNGVNGEGVDEPFGFAAFTSLAQSKSQQSPGTAARDVQ